MKAAYDDHSDFLSRGPYARFVTERRSVGRYPIRMFRTAQPAGNFSDPAQPDLVLYKLLRSERYTIRDLGAGRVRHRFRRGDFDLQAPRVGNEVIADGPHELIDFVLPLEAVCEVVGESQPGFIGDFGQLHAAPFRDIFLEQLCIQLWRESESGNPYGTLFVEGVLISMIAVLLRLHDRRSAAVWKASAPISPAALQKVEDYIETNLNRDFSNADLSSLARLPLSRFTRAFKASTGESPHQYVLSRRILRARELLASANMPLAEVAYACGFASQSHMTDVFRTKLGVTPGRYRKEVRG